MDVRYTGHYYQLFPQMSDWARVQSGSWERNTRFHIGSVHNSSEKYMEPTSNSLPAPHPWVGAILPREPSAEADLITLFPMFDVSHTVWPHKDYLIGYTSNEVPLRFGTVGTNMRLSRALLQLMSSENKRGKSMMSEMWPTTLAFHHGLKTVYFPHPIFLEHVWSGPQLQENYNGGKDGRVGGSWTSVINHEEDFLGATWFWNAKWSRQLYEMWMGIVTEGPGSPEVKLPESRSVSFR